MKNTKTKKQKIQEIIKILIALTIVAGSIYLARYAKFEHIRDFVQSYGVWGEVIYVLCWVVLPIFMFPVPVIAFAGGVMYGIGKGSLLTMLGAMLNVIVVYFLSRYVAKDFVEKIILNRVSGKLREKLLTKDQKSLFVVLTVMRIMPIVSFSLSNYLAGITNVKFWVHMLSSVIGIIPGTLIFLNFGDKMLEPGSASFIIAAVLLALIIIVPIFFTRKYFGDLVVKKSDDNSSDLQ